MGLILSTTVSAKTILIHGDSLSAAHGLPLEQGWAALLEDRLQKSPEKSHWRIVNSSISGETTAGGLARLKNLLDKHKPDLCLIELGANDGLRGQSLSIMRSNLQKMIDDCSCHGDVVLIGMKLPPNYGKAYTDQFIETYSRLAEQNQIPLVHFLLDGVSENPELMQQDRLHPNSHAQPIILETVWEKLKSLLE
ncbi:MAG: arylesterase [Gammaproteobacteria bacterium]